MPAILKTLPQTLRPREKILAHSQHISLNDVLAALIGSGCAGMPLEKVVAEAKELILTAPENTIPDFHRIKGIGSASAAKLAAALILQQTLTQERCPQQLTNPALLYEACTSIRFAKQEHVLVLYLNTHISCITQEVITIGTVSASLIHPREVFRPAIACNASFIALAHNHPSGVATPSAADREVTKKIAQAGALIGITLVDHLICTSTSYTSLKMEAPHLFC